MNIPRPVLIAGTIILIFIMFGACVTLTFALVRSRTPGLNSVSGQVALQQGVTLPGDVQVKVQIVDITSADASAGSPVNLGEQTISNPGEFPVLYEVAYDLKTVDDTHNYIAQAQVLDSGGNLVLANKTGYPVITQGHPSTDVEIIVEPFTEAPSTVPESPAGSNVSGNVTYQERAALPAGAQVVVQLLDTSAADASAQVIDDQVIPNPGQPPVSFNLIYDPQVVDQAHSYVVRAQISDAAGEALFVTRSDVPVITQGHPTMGLEVIVEPVGAQSPGSASLTGILTYREKIALPAKAVAYVQLIDLTVGDTSAGWVTKQTIPQPGQVPISFNLQYDPNQIVQDHLYSIKASIEDGAGNMLFATTRNYPVITLGNPVAGIEVILERVYKGLELCPQAAGVCAGVD